MSEQFKHDLKTIASRVEQRLAEIFDAPSSVVKQDLFETDLLSSPNLLEQVRDLTMRGGKRLRAALVLQGGALFDAKALDSPAHLETAVAMELTQTYLLIHDDIMDDDETRRGGPTTHAALRQQGLGRHEAMGLAVLAGDLAQALAELVISNLDAPAATQVVLRRILSGMHLDVIHGQTLDVTASSDAETIARHKTASYTTMGPLLAGAALAGLDARGLEKLAGAALPLGIAFQLQDDVLGLFGDAQTTGKPRATDLRQGKHNWLIERCLESGSDELADKVTLALGKTDASDALVAEALRAIEQSGAKREAAKRVRLLIEQFKTSIQAMGARKAAVAFLCDLAAYMGSRNL